MKKETREEERGKEKKDQSKDENTRRGFIRQFLYGGTLVHQFGSLGKVPQSRGLREQGRMT